MSTIPQKIRIISPSGVVNIDYLDGAANLLRSWGWEVSEGDFARASFGRYAGTNEERIQDLQEAISDEGLQAVLCSRGGYGLVQIIDEIDFTSLLKHPKLFIGFSDITVLHAALSKLNIPSVHAVMAKQLTEFDAEDDSLLQLKAILKGQFPQYQIETDALNIYGQAGGKLVGGNLAVLMGLMNTPFEPDFQDSILFIEEIAEEAYRIDRMMQQLRLSGVLNKISGLVLGHFTDCPEDEEMHLSIKENIIAIASEYQIPVCANFPAGHDHPNLPLIMNKEVSLLVNEKGTELDFS
jgi:muramoyltetrapeptide carboxypeptidase